MIVPELNEDFVNHMQVLQDTAEANGAATCLDGQRKWYYPPLNGWSGNVTDITGMNDAFARDDLGTQYQAVNTAASGGTIGESMVVKLQNDYIAAAERAFRTRHASSVRCRIHAASRRKGHGNSLGIFSTNGNIQGWLNNIIASSVEPT